jgi:GT2 family glycosyltransferase
MGIRTGEDTDVVARSLNGAVSHVVDGRVLVHGKLFARGGERLRLRGVTYGPFAPNREGQPFPTRRRAGDDLAGLQALGANSIRVYHVPPEWMLDLVDERGLTIFVDVPWPTHVCFLGSRRAQADARRSVRRAAEAGRDHPGILAYNIGNEIPTDIIRWHGTRRIERFFAELRDVVKQADPDGLVTYASYPPTEYLELPFLDFVTFNVYLHDHAAFRDYVFRLQNLVGDRPLVLGELGLDTLRHGEAEQARLLAGHLRETELMGLAGAYVFSWTDDWHTGGFPVEDWAFGITRADRAPKVSYHAVQQVFRTPLPLLLGETPRVSVVVCAHNGGATLDECLRSLSALDYPDYEVIVVDDGSTDDTREILARFPGVMAIHQAHSGLSVARNAGLQRATGTLIAYTDSDCVADRNWLIYLVHQLRQSGAAAVGGPNLTPEDGWLAACVAAAPGQPTHVLVSDQIAEHIPGCNMAFRREALEAINGFDPQFRKAGDDVDICWRLQHQGHVITFAPGAFVWHHRRQNPRSYLKQQAGYGEAEALLHFKHPDKFNGRGDGKWGGVMYGGSLQGLQVALPIIYRGTFGTGMFQCLYQPGAAHWAMLPSTFEWHVAALLIGLVGAIVRPWGWVLGANMLGLSLLVTALQAAQARGVPTHRRRCARLLIAALCYAQPLVRSWMRYRTRLSSQRAPGSGPSASDGPRQRLSWTGHRSVAYWSEAGIDRTQILRRALAFLDEHRWGKVLDTGWFEWDMAVYCDSGLILKVVTVQEEHGQGKRLIRIRYQLGPTARLRVIGAVSIVALAVVALTYPRVAMGAAALVLGLGVRAWVRGLAAATRVMALFRAQAHRMHLIDCTEETRSPSVPAVSRDEPDSRSVADPDDHGQSAQHPGGAEVRDAFTPAFRSVVALDGPSPSENKEQFA